MFWYGHVVLVVRSRYDVGALLIRFEYSGCSSLVRFGAARHYLLAMCFRIRDFHTCQLLRTIIVVFSADHLCCVKTFLRHRQCPCQEQGVLR
jgi:hypothetical protein